MNLVYQDNDGTLHRVRDTDAGVNYYVQMSLVASTADAVEYVRNFGIARRNYVASGTMTKITYDKWGIVVSGTNATTADIDDTPGRRYVTDEMLANLTKSVTSISQKRVNLSYPSGEQSIQMIPLRAHEANLAYTVKFSLTAAANQNNKTIFARINGDTSYELFNITEKFDGEVITVTAEGICDNTFSTTQEWVVTVLALNVNTNHSQIYRKTVTGCTPSSLILYISTVQNNDLSLISCSSYYCRL